MAGIETSSFECPNCHAPIEVRAPERDVYKIYCAGWRCALWFTPLGKILSEKEAAEMPETTRLSDVFRQKHIVSPEKDIDLLVWDLETTGFVAPECKILEIGAFIVKDGVVEEKHWVFQNNVEIPEKITEITGITKEIIDAEGRDPKECLQEFLPLFKRCKQNLTHNGIRFDIPFLTDFAESVLEWTPEEKKAVVGLIRQSAFDTAVHFKAKKCGMRQADSETFVIFADRVMNTRAFGVKYTLGLCCDELAIDRTKVVQHRALADVFLTHEIFKKINP